MAFEQNGPESSGDKYESYRESSKANPRCYTQTFIHTTCRVQDDADSGLPSRKCERLIRKFEDCGRSVFPPTAESSDFARFPLALPGVISHTPAHKQLGLPLSNRRLPR